MILCNNKGQNKKEHKKLKVLCACPGRYEIIETFLASLIKELYSIRKEVSLIFVFDGNYWKNIPLVQSLNFRFPSIKIIYLEEESHLPAYMYNIGLADIGPSFINFIWPGCAFSAENVKLFIEKIQSEDEPAEVYYLKKEKPDNLPFYPPDPLRYGWCQCEKIFHLEELFIDSTIFEVTGFFNESKIIQKYFDWDFIIRLAREFDFVESGTSKGESSILDFINYPYNKSYNISKDLAHRYILRYKTVKANQVLSDEQESDFLKDLPLNDRAYTGRIIQKDFIPEEKKGKKYKITILGGFWEYIHNQLCFFNYLDKLYGKQFATYKVLLDFTANISDIKYSDLVIFSRCRDPKISLLIDYCNRNNIATLYMLDDNWIAVGKDWPDDYGHIFTPGNIGYDTFIEALMNCKATLVYNKYLEEDIKTYVNKIYRLSVNVNTDFYKVPEKSDKSKAIIGYSGSLRYNLEAFQALAEVAEENKDITLLIFGNITSKQEEILNKFSFIKVDYKSYLQYCKHLAYIKPLILLAPLDNSRFSMSKCPNKYLEIASVGSCGIYSDIYPYSEVIEDGVNGFLVKEDKKEFWIEKIIYLLKNRHIIKKVIKNSMEDIKQNYSTEVIMKNFLQVISSVIEDE